MISVSGRGDQDGAVHLQGHAVKVPFTDDIGHRLPLQAAGEQLFQPALHRMGGVEAAVAKKIVPALAGGVAHQLPGLQLRCLDAGLAQLLTGI